MGLSWPGTVASQKNPDVDIFRYDRILDTMGDIMDELFIYDRTATIIRFEDIKDLLIANFAWRDIEISNQELVGALREWDYKGEHIITRSASGYIGLCNLRRRPRTKL